MDTCKNLQKKTAQKFLAGISPLKQALEKIEPQKLQKKNCIMSIFPSLLHNKCQQ